MTTLDSFPAQSTTTAPAVRRRSKSVLFCPSCGHESPLNGDWTVDSDDGTNTYRCPECHTVVSNRNDRADE